MVEFSQVKVVGFSIVGVVASLKRHHKGMPPNVPDSLKGYFARELGPLEWHPLPDYVALFDMMLQVIAPREQRMQACYGIGTFAGKRDAGVPAGPGEPPRNPHPHFSVSFDRVHGLAVTVRRALITRERYYSRGYYRVKRTKSHELELVLHEFPASAELCAVSTGYLAELFAAADIGAQVRLTSCLGLGQGSCTWHLTFNPEVDPRSLAAFD